MKKNFGQFKIELGHGCQNGTPMRKWKSDKAVISETIA
jgi:hypothetical protein